VSDVQWLAAERTSGHAKILCAAFRWTTLLKLSLISVSNQTDKEAIVADVYVHHYGSFVKTFN